tara:strand:- start:4699 stop:5175 length:477 start_codon:yes stop_codon:yes gene_type:complete
MADWQFNGITKIIKEPNTGSGNLNWNVEKDIYSAWKRWVVDNSQFDAAFTVEGGTPIGATGIFTGKTIILVNGWKLMAGDWDHISFVTGNLFSDDGIDTVPNPSHSASLKTFGSVNAQGITAVDIDLSLLATKVNQQIINDGIKKASLLIPHSTDTNT